MSDKTETEIRVSIGPSVFILTIIVAAAIIIQAVIR